MKKKFSDTIKSNRGIGDQRIRNMEQNQEKIAEEIDAIHEEISERDPIAFVEQLPLAPDPKILYFVTD